MIFLKGWVIIRDMNKVKEDFLIEIFYEYS